MSPRPKGSERQSAPKKAKTPKKKRKSTKSSITIHPIASPSQSILGDVAIRKGNLVVPFADQEDLTAKLAHVSMHLLDAQRNGAVSELLASADASTVPALTEDFCIHAVVASTPKPQRYKEGTAGNTTLFSLGVVDAIDSGHFLDRLKRQIKPWKIEDEDVPSSPDTTVEACADAVLNNASE